jgi:signal transduction histidine kinase
MGIDWVGKLRRLLQTLAFCLGIAALQWFSYPERPYAPMLVYSVAIGVCTWAWIDFGAHLFPSSRDTGWPSPPAAALLVSSGIAAGFALGTLAGDLWFEQAPWSHLRHMSQPQMRGSIFITAIISIAITYYFYSQGRSAYLARKMREAHQHATEARLKLLEAQLEPHMLFNTLANLRALIGVDPARAQAMLDRLIAFLRATLGASRAAQHPLAAEFERVADYLALMGVRLGPRLQVQVDLPDALRAQPVPPLLLQPLVENSIRHGIEPQVQGGRIEVAARREGDALVLSVRDTGAGLGAAGATAGTRFGLQQVRERLAAQYGDRAALVLEAAPGGGTLARIALPLAASSLDRNDA